MAVEILRLPDAWVPDDGDRLIVDVEAQIEDDALVLVVAEGDTGEIRIPLDEFEDLVEFVERMKIKKEEEADGD